MKSTRVIAWVAALAVAAALLAPAAVSQPGGDRVIRSLVLQNAKIGSVLSFLSDYSGQNIVAGPQVEGLVTLQLTNVTWREALDIIMRTYNLALVEEEGYFRVLRMDDYLKEQSDLAKHRSEQLALMLMTTEVVRVHNAAAVDLKSSVLTVLSERGEVNVDDRTNSLVITDVPDAIAKAREIVAALDVETGQIKISAQILEVATLDLQELGVDWSAISTKMVVVDPIEGTLAPAYSFETPNQRVADPAFRFGYASVEGKFIIQNVLAALMQSTNTKLLAHPEVTTVDNLEAIIRSGQRIPFQMLDEQGNTVTEFIEVGIILRVTPHITSERRILMQLAPERSTYEFAASGQLIITEQKAETNVVVDDGQTVVIGGMTNIDETESESGIPILKDIPLIGNLFKYSRSQTQSRDVVMFVTPTIVTEQFHIEQ
jgi:type IV pilus secretin PilQ/predicted competence protein